MEKLLKVADIRFYMDKVAREEISYSRAVELINEAANRAIEIQKEGNYNFVKKYHNREKSRGKLLTTDIHLFPEEDGNLMSITNELIREGWELTRIESLEKYKEISRETIKLVFHRWIEK